MNLRAQAEAEATRLRAGADVLKTHAEAAAIRLRSGVYAEKVQAELAALHLRAAWQRAGSLARSLGALALVAALGADWVVHENDTFIKWRLASQLRSCRVPEAAAASLMPLEELLVKRSPFVPGFRPVLVLAPTGAGKSTLLAAAARATTSADAHHAPAPAALVRIRQTPSKDERLELSVAAEGASDIALGQAKSARDMLGSTAVRIFEQIGFPTRRAVLQRLFERGISIRLHGIEYEMQEADRTACRLVQALEALFNAAASVGRERVAAGLSLWDAAPVLLFDEVQDLIRDDRLARAGGSLVFKALARLLVTHCVDGHAVRAAMSGSSALLSVFFDRTVASGFRLTTYSLPDPEPEVVLHALRACGYTADEAADMVALCGTRLRLLDGPLKQGAASIGARAFMDAARATAKAHFADLLAAASAADARALVSTLDAALACEAGTCDEPPNLLGRTFTLRHAEAASKVLFLRLDRTLEFQSRLHANVWRAERRRFAHATTLRHLDEVEL